MRFGFRFSVYSLLLIATSCAIQVAPTGGDKDIKSPKIEKSSPENFSTNFSGHDINISFNEYITLKDLSTQLVISPPLKHTPDTKVKKKTLSIHLNDTLQQNKTYTMNFGNAITDLHEGNAVEDYQYVFSTGDVIDSLKVSGKVENGLDKKTEKGIYVMLYGNTDDSLPLKMLPDYFGKASDSGAFIIRNVSPGSYRIFALKDDNSNYLFDSRDEAIAFETETVEAGKTGVLLRMFKEKGKQQLLKATCEEPGKATVSYASPLVDSRIKFLSDTSALQLFSILYSEKKDSITFWYRNQLSDSLNFILQRDTARDTISVRLKKTDGKGKAKYIPSLTTQYASQIENGLEVGKPLQLVFNHPVDSFDLKKIKLTEDSVEVKNMKVFFADSLKEILKVDYAWKEKTKYTIDIPPQTFKDIFEIRNDTLQLLFKTKSVADYGTLALKIQLPFSDKQYLVQLMDDKETVYRQSVIHTDTTLNYEYLNPRSYRLKVIEDLNSNGEWDTGNYLKHEQPERVFYYKENLIVRANWDVDVKWNIADSNN